MPYVDIDLEVDREAMRQERYDAIAARFPGWEASPGNLETALVDGDVDQLADLNELAIDVAASIFDKFGTDIVGITRGAAASALADTTWTMVDDAGYTIPAGALVGIAASGSLVYAFAVVEEVTVPAGETETETGEVVIRAVIEGSAPNGLESDPAPIDALSYVSAITLESAPSGGLDEEAVDDFLDRLREEMRLLSPRPILPDDFAALARRVSGVHRAVAIDNLDPGDGSTDNERMVTVAAIDEDGAAVSSGIKTAVEDLLDGMREVNFVVHVTDPDTTAVDVAVTVVPFDGFDADEIEASVEAALSDYLNPATWGQPPNDPIGWRNVTTVYRFELISLVDRAPGVDRVSALTLRAHGVGSLGTADVTLDGYAPLASAGDFTVTVS